MGFGFFSLSFLRRVLLLLFPRPHQRRKKKTRRRPRHSPFSALRSGQTAVYESFTPLRKKSRATRERTLLVRIPQWNSPSKRKKKRRERKDYLGKHQSYRDETIFFSSSFLLLGHDDDCFSTQRWNFNSKYGFWSGTIDLVERYPGFGEDSHLRVETYPRVGRRLHVEQQSSRFAATERIYSSQSFIDITGCSISFVFVEKSTRVDAARRFESSSP